MIATCSSISPCIVYYSPSCKHMLNIFIILFAHHESHEMFNKMRIARFSDVFINNPPSNN